MKKKSKPFTRKLYSVEVKSNSFTVHGGAHVTKCDAEGNHIERVYDSKARLWANVGDRYLVIGGGYSVVEIVGIEKNGSTCQLKVIRGDLLDGNAHIMRFLQAAAKKAA